VKHKFIREARDFWYEICAKRFASDGDQLAAIAERLGTLATKEDVERLAIQNTGYVLGAVAVVSNSPTRETYSFEREQFIHPRIVHELLGFLSDPIAAVVAVDLPAANSSNRFFGEYSRRIEDGRTWITWRGNEESFSYAYVDTSPSGIQMVECHYWCGGTGVFGSVGLFSVELDHSLVDAHARLIPRPRMLLKTVGAIPLGDRYSGKISYANGLLHIGPDAGHFALGDEAARLVAIR
jgi:hypothetical protein